MILYKYNFYKKDGINVSLFEKFIDMIENSNDNQSFKLVTKDGKSHKGGCLIIVIATVLIFKGMFSGYNNNDRHENVPVVDTSVVVTSSTTIAETIETKKTTVSTKEITVNPKYTTYDGDNPLMALKVKTTKIPKIDKNRGYIEISKDDFSNVTNEDYLEFCESVVSKNKGNYNYFTIDFGDGTGICYSGCYIYDATYGNLDDTGAVEEKLGSIQIDIENHEISSDSFNFAESETSVSKATQVTTITTPISTTTSTVTTTVEETEPSQVVETVPVTNSYVLNTSTMKFHKSNCRDVEKIAPENYDTFSGSRDEVINMGYDPCGHCKP